jgi:hypothetical protein
MCRVQRLVRGFIEQLDAQGVTDYDASFVKVAVYDAPYKVFDRRNELWLLKRSGPDGADEQPLNELGAEDDAALVQSS